MTFLLHSDSARLSCLRQELGLSVGAFAKLLQTSATDINQWEHGQADVPDEIWHSLEQIRQIYELSETSRAV